MNTISPDPAEGIGPLRESSAAGYPGGRSDFLSDNPYAAQYRQTPEPDLDAAAPQLKSQDLRRLNQRALLLFAAVVLLLLFVAYWMISSAGSHGSRIMPREERVTVSEAPRSTAVPQQLPVLPTRAPQAIPLAPQAMLPPLPVAPPRATTIPPDPASTLAQRRIAASNSPPSANQSSFVPASGPLSGLPANPQGSSAKQSDRTSAQSLGHVDTLMQRGTYIRCVLETHIVSDIPGFASCLVTERVYSFDGRRMLLPKGSKILGTYDKNPIGRRVAVVWDRIITPSGINVNMASPGIDNMGGAGLPGHYDAHWGTRISSALLISMLSDAFKYEAAEHGPRSTTISNGVVTQQPFESNTAQTVQSLANQAVRDAANRPPTITINQGTVVYVYVAKDVDFSGVVARF